ncbi:hypothetical protein AC579_9903 [Pseudocercospora musae]|uniref:BOD1/SHG1 domain-containing protein n=1 Tax=Pseudocercospora musae TaxID=113226 RepID=A0A139IFG8_9PEZI|nr:hypothetical protein AC579_9903 [Pseudocercospora musae]
MAALDVAMSGTNDFELPARKRPKIQELPLSGAQHDAIDSMLHTFKKKGEFDVLRKKAIQQYNESAERGMFEASLRTFTSAEIDRDPMKYLRPDKRIAAPLLEGSAARADVYGKTEADIDAYIDQFMAGAERALRDIRRKEIGDDAVEEEIRKGGKTDAEYAAEAEQRRQDRAKKFIEDERVRKRKEAQERKKKELEALRKKQEALQKETERLQREQKRRAERDAWKLAEKERERERIKQFNEEREKAKKEAEEREKALQEERERRQKERQEREQKRLEAEALDLLLREGQEMAEKARRPELERSESMEPPVRLKHQRAPKDSQGKDSMRAQGLLPTSLTLRKGDKPGDKAQGDKAEKESTPAIPTGPRKDPGAVSPPSKDVKDATDENPSTVTLVLSGRRGKLVNAGSLIVMTGTGVATETETEIENEIENGTEAETASENVREKETEIGIELAKQGSGKMTVMRVKWLNVLLVVEVHGSPGRTTTVQLAHGATTIVAVLHVGVTAKEHDRGLPLDVDAIPGNVAGIVIEIVTAAVVRPALTDTSQARADRPRRKTMKVHVDTRAMKMKLHGVEGTTMMKLLVDVLEMMIIWTESFAMSVICLDDGMTMMIDPDKGLLAKTAKSAPSLVGLANNVKSMRII